MVYFASGRKEANQTLDYQDEKTKVYRILDFTSLTVGEFDLLVPPFEAVFARVMED